MKVVPYSILTVFVNIVTMIIPMMTQLSCLIFGWIRQARRDNPPPQSPLIDRQPLMQNKYVKDVVRPDYISYYDPTVEYYIVDVSQYLPGRRVLDDEEGQKSKSNPSFVSDDANLLNTRSNDRA